MPRTVKTIPAIHANAGVEAWYRRELEVLVTAAQLELTRIAAEAIYDAARRPAVLVTTAPLTMDAGDVTKLDRQLKAWAKKWQVHFDKVSVTLARKFAKKSFAMTESSMRDALKQAGFTVSFKPTRQSLEAYKAVAAENVNLIKSIPAKYLTGVQSAVWSSVNRGADMASLSKQLTAEYGSTVERAALIARDQNNKAKATIESTRRLQLGITEAIWQHSSGGKEPRPTHVAMNGKLFKLKEGMYDSEEKAYILPGQLINCRCTSRAVIPGLDDAV